MELKTDRQIASCKNLGSHTVGMKRLYLNIYENNDGLRKRWRARVTINGCRQWIEIGQYPEVSLKLAKQKTEALVVDIRNGIHPSIKKSNAKKAVVEQAKKIEKEGKSFRSVAAEYISIRSKMWAEDSKSHTQWPNTLRDHAMAYIGDKVINEITPDDVFKLLDKIWSSNNETARRVQKRIEAIINYGISEGYSDKANPANYEVFLSHRLFHNKEKEPHAALNYEDLKKFSDDLHKYEADSYDCAELILHTQVRSKDARSAKWDDFNIDEGYWDAWLHKPKKRHRIPLTKPVIRMLTKRLQKSDIVSEYVFPGSGDRSYISGNAVKKSIDNLHYKSIEGKSITLHGFRSTFADWVAENNEEEDAVAQMQLGHKLKDKTKAAYFRGPLFTRRVKLMERYSNYIEGTYQVQEAA